LYFGLINGKERGEITMKKNMDEKKRARRLTLSRETIQILDNPSLLELARVHGQSGSQCLKCIEPLVGYTTACVTTSLTC
jgi:hypothetical protein